MVREKNQKTASHDDRRTYRKKAENNRRTTVVVVALGGPDNGVHVAPQTATHIRTSIRKPMCSSRKYQE